MPRTGATFNLLNNTNYPAVEDEVIDQDGHNAMLEDLAQGLTESVSRDGAGTMTGDLNMGTNKLTNLAAGSANGHSVRYEQVQLANAFATAWEGAAWGAGKMGYATGASSVSLIDTTAAGRAFLNYTDPNADKIVYWKDADGTIASVSLGTGLAFSGGSLSLDADLVTWSGLTPSAFFQTLVDDADASTFLSTLGFSTFAKTLIDDADAAAVRTTLGLGTAAVKATGTSGNNVPLLDGANTWSAAQLYQGDLTISKATPNLTLVGTSTNIPAIELKNASRYDDIRNTTSGLSLRYDTSGTPKEMLWNGTNLTLNSVAVPTISSSDTLSNKTLSSPALSGIFDLGSTGNPALFMSGDILYFQADDNDYFRFDQSDNAWYFDIGGVNKVTISAAGMQAIVAVSSETSGTLTSASSNKQVNASADITINDGVHAAGDRIEIYAGASARSIIQDTGMTLRLDGTSTTGTRSLPARGRASVYFVSNSEAIVSGMGVT